MRIALCSPGLSRALPGARTVGLDFLARLIHDRFPRVEFASVSPRDVPLLSPRSVDLLLVSCTGIDAAMEYARAVRFQRPRIRTLLGGPGMLAPAAFRDVADAIIVGRGEEAIFRALDGDYTGMMRYDSTLSENECWIWPTTLLSPGMACTGCRFRCGFCSYGWAHVFATADTAACDKYRSGSTAQAGRKQAPGQELMLKDLQFNMLSRTQWHTPVVGLDILTDLDRRCVRKPVSFALLRSVAARLAEEARGAAAGVYRVRLYTIAAYPWDPPAADFRHMDEAFRVRLPDGVRVCWDVGLSHFSPHVTTPMETCAVSGYDLRQAFASYDNTWPSEGMFWTLDKHTVPSPRQAVLNAITMRTPDPTAIARLARCPRWQDMLDAFPRECGWLTERPAPWLRRNNDASDRVQMLYEALGRPCPSGYAPFKGFQDRYGVAQYGGEVHPSEP